MQAIEMRWNIELGVSLPISLPDSTMLDLGRMPFDVLAEEFGLRPDDFGREFSTGRERFRVAGIDPR